MATFAQFDTSVKETYFNEQGQKVEIIEVRARHHAEFKKSKRGHIVRVDGENVAYSGHNALNDQVGGGGLKKIGSSESLSNATSWAETEYAGEAGQLMGESEYKTFKEDKESEEEAKKFEQDIKKETATIRQTAEDTTLAQEELANIKAGKVLSANQKALEKALLTQGATPEELGTVYAQGEEATANLAKEISAQSGANLQNTMTQLAQMDVGAVKDASQLQTALKGLNQQLLQHNLSLENALDIANLNAKTQESVASKGIWSEIAGGLGGAAAGWLLDDSEN